jgi:lysyl-tRNA synthetase class I
VSSRRRQKQIRKLALAVRRYGALSEDMLTTMRCNQSAPTINEVTTMLQSHTLSGRDANMLQHLLETLKCASRWEEREAEKIRAMLREQEARRTMIEHDRIMEKLTKAHPQGEIIGRTKVTEYKPPGSSIQWATKRKRKP